MAERCCESRFSGHPRARPGKPECIVILGRMRCAEKLEIWKGGLSLPFRMTSARRVAVAADCPAVAAAGAVLSWPERCWLARR